MVWFFDREKYGSSAEPGIQEPATVAKRTRTAPIAEASVMWPGRSQYIQKLTSRAIGIVMAIVKVPQHVGSIETNTADINNAQVTLPEGLTLDPSAAHGLTACTEAEFPIHSTAKVECPEDSEIGTVAIETDLPPKSLSGKVFLASPSGAKITKPPVTIYLDAESSIGVAVRLGRKRDAVRQI